MRSNCRYPHISGLPLGSNCATVGTVEALASSISSSGVVAIPHNLVDGVAASPAVGYAVAGTGFDAMNVPLATVRAEHTQVELVRLACRNFWVTSDRGLGDIDHSSFAIGCLVLCGPIFYLPVLVVKPTRVGIYRGCCGSNVGYTKKVVRPFSPCL